jgi:N-methylhydantoinase B
MASTVTALDPVTLTVIQAGLIQVCNEMDLAFVRRLLARHRRGPRPLGRHLSPRRRCLIAQGELGLPVFVGTMQFSTQAVIAKIDTGETSRPATSTSSTTPISAART